MFESRFSAAALTFFFAAVVVVQKLSFCPSVGEVVFIILHDWNNKKKECVRRRQRLQTGSCCTGRSSAAVSQSLGSQAELQPSTIRLTERCCAGQHDNGPVSSSEWTEGERERARERREGGEENKSRASFTANVQPADTAEGERPGEPLPSESQHTHTFLIRRSRFLLHAKYYYTHTQLVNKLC